MENPPVFFLHMCLIHPGYLNRFNSNIYFNRIYHPPHFFPNNFQVDLIEKPDHLYYTQVIVKMFVNSLFHPSDSAPTYETSIFFSFDPVDI